MKKIISLLLPLLFVVAAFSQTKPKVKGWHLLDFEKDGYMGISLDKAYELLKGRKSTTVVVAVIDSGIDTVQEDLKSVLWTNPKEIAGNGKDDDGNGYVDDIHGWNFCGSRDGENLSRNSYEIARVYHNWKNEFEGKRENNIPASEKFLYAQWIKAEKIITRDYDEASKQLPQISEFLKALELSADEIYENLTVKEFSSGQLKPLLQRKDDAGRAAAFWTDIFSRGSDTSIRNTEVIRQVTDYRNDLQNKIRRKEEKPEDTRGALTKDNYADINDRFYGNNNLKGGSGNHGTLVAGIIGAVRGNGLGIDGIADNVRIMTVRAVPGGDEHDKDVALAIRYAVDNGASIINMSFGKAVSPYKKFVDDAVRYAASKGVLLIHGAGNDGKDITTETFYPNPVFINNERAENYMTVGASGDSSTGGYAASFSNFSNKWVDLFAPGVYINSTASGNTYEAADGTSLACPVVTGVAALLKSYFPYLTPEKMISLLTESGKKLDADVIRPGENEKETKVPFASLSSSGRIVNAFGAVKLALEWERKGSPSGKGERVRLP